MNFLKLKKIKIDTHIPVNFLFLSVTYFRKRTNLIASMYYNKVHFDINRI